MRCTLPLVFSFFIIGCGGAQVASAPPRVVQPSATLEPPPATAAVKPAGQTEQEILAAVPAAPEACNAFREHLNSASVACSDKKSAILALDKAIGETDALARDAALAQLGNCRDFEPGLIVALRAEFAPATCSDVLVGEFPVVNKAKLNPALGDALIGLELAAKLARLVRTAPHIDKPYTKERIDGFVKQVMAQWAVAQANAISTLSLKGARLAGYGKGLVAVEAGMADMRFVEVFRHVPIPDEFANDPELTDTYYSALDQGLEPRKARGRDAALVGLRAFSDVGVLKDVRVDQARALLSHLFNGRRIDALDSLLLPPTPKAELNDEEQRLAAILPTFYVEFVLGSVDPSRETLLRALLERGLPSSLQGKLERSVLTAGSRQLLARALFERGRTYWRASDFSAAAAMATTRQPGPEESKLILALSRALEKGPKDAAAMMLGSTKLDELGDLTQLEALTKSKGPIAALATYDAAVIRQLGSSTDSSAEFFAELATRYERAANLLKDPEQKKLAKERAAAAADTAKKLR